MKKVPENIEDWYSLAYDIYTDLSEFSVIFEELIDRRRERPDADLDFASIMGVIKRSVQHTQGKAEELKGEIHKFIND